MTMPRSTIMNDEVMGVFHCHSRCVRRAYLCGRDSYTKKNYDHRKIWLYNRMKELAGIFHIDVCGYAVMSNHFHLILRNRPDLVVADSDIEIARRWLRLFPKQKVSDDKSSEPSEKEVSALLMANSRMSVLRKRLSSISWFMRCLKENIARRANEEDKCTGRFWEGRFKSTELLDEAAIATCAAYVDLNPIRAGEALTPEDSAFTSIEERIVEIQEREGSSAKISNLPCQDEKSGANESTLDLLLKPTKHSVVPPYREKVGPWLCPLQDEPGRLGFLNMELTDYFELVDWTGRQIVEGKDGAIPSNLSPILTRLHINHRYWPESSCRFGELFYRVAGTRKHMEQAAYKAGQQWMRQSPKAWWAFESG